MLPTTKHSEVNDKDLFSLSFIGISFLITKMSDDSVKEYTLEPESELRFEIETKKGKVELVVCLNRIS